MAARPSSPTISYLPAFVTVGIVQSLCRHENAALTAQTLRVCVRFRLLNGRTGDYPPACYGPFPVLKRRNCLRRHPDALSSTVPIGFSLGQRYQGTSVSHSIRGSALACERRRLGTRFLPPGAGGLPPIRGYASIPWATWCVPASAR